MSYILTVRRSAEKADSINKEVALANRRLKRKLVLSDRALSNRSDKNGSRQRTFFCRELSDHLHDNLTGRRHYDAVAELCQIAFDYSGAVDARSARRESTRKRHR